MTGDHFFWVELFFFGVLTLFTHVEGCSFSGMRDEQIFNRYLEEEKKHVGLETYEGVFFFPQRTGVLISSLSHASTSAH